MTLELLFNSRRKFQIYRIIIIIIFFLKFRLNNEDRCRENLVYCTVLLVIFTVPCDSVRIQCRFKLNNFICKGLTRRFFLMPKVICNIIISVSKFLRIDSNSIPRTYSYGSQLIISRATLFMCVYTTMMLSDNIFYSLNVSISLTLLCLET